MQIPRKIIAEIGSVHDGSFGNAINLINLAKNCGAQAAKFQMHIAEFETTRYAPNPDFFQGESRYDYFKRINFTKQQWKEISNHCKETGIDFVCSPFSNEALDILVEIDVDAIKIASGEISNISLIERALETTKPVFISTGMSNYSEIETIVNIVEKSKFKDNAILMQCTSLYPCPPGMAGLNVLAEFISKFRLKLGFSDHTCSNSAAVIAAYLGADFIEKHITFSNLMYGSDAKFAYNPELFVNYVKDISESWIMRDNPVEKDDLKPFKNIREVFQKSWTLKRSLEKGSILTQNDLILKKPGTGLSYHNINNILGRKVLRDLEGEYQIKLEDLI
jgi:N,N'-diacetyllegionaminate synthase